MAKSVRFTQEMHSFMRDIIPDHDTAEVAELFSQRFGVEYSESAVKAYRSRYKIPSKKRKKYYSMKWSKEVLAICSALCEEHRQVKEIAAILTETYDLEYTDDQVKAFLYRHGLKTGNDTRIKPGNIPYTKGKTWDEFMPQESQERSRKTCFKKGHRPANWQPEGTVVIDSFGKPRLKYKESDPVHHRFCWKQLDRVTLELQGVDIPKNSIILHLDNDQLNCEPDNLMAVSKPKGVSIINSELLFSDREIMDTVQLMTDVKLKALDIRKKRRAERRKQNEEQT